MNIWAWVLVGTVVLLTNIFWLFFFYCADVEDDDMSYFDD